jgi:hypothetical protein
MQIDGTHKNGGKKEKIQCRRGMKVLGDSLILE